MKTCINISFPNNVSFRKKVHSQTSDHVWFFLNLFSKRPREKKRKKGKREKKEFETEFQQFVILYIKRSKSPRFLNFLEFCNGYF